MKNKLLATIILLTMFLVNMGSLSDVNRKISIENRIKAHNLSIEHNYIEEKTQELAIDPSPIDA